MKIQILRNKLDEILNVVSNICPRKSDFSILNNFYLKATKNNNVEILATDLEISYQVKFETKVFEPGEILIPAKQFQSIIDNFFEDEVSLETTERSNLVIKGNKIFANLTGLSSEEYPILSPVNKSRYLILEPEIFDNYLNKLWPILTTSDIKPEYNGILFHLKNEIIHLVATDTIRLGEQIVQSQYFETNLSGEYKLLIPKRILQEYRRLKRKTGKVYIYIEENQVSFEIMDQIFTTKLFSVEYPPYEKIKPSSFLISFEVDREEIVKALKLNRVFMNQFKELEFRLDPKANILELFSSSDLLGENKNTLEVKVHNQKDFIYEPYHLKFNLDFLLDGFSTIEGEKVFCGFFSGAAEKATPLLLKSIPNEDFLYILMHYSQ